VQAFIPWLALVACEDQLPPSRTSLPLEVSTTEPSAAASGSSTPTTLFATPPGRASASARAPIDLLDCARLLEIAREAGFRGAERDGDLLTLERGGSDCDHDSLAIERRPSALRAWKIEQGPHHRELRGPLARGSVTLRVNTVDAPTRADAALLEQLRAALEGCRGS
jgi:hypothetical protein